ncbi:SAPS-domain-containing protein [Dendrothele bispora CBS 962.96]|uniref:SAPS-domain-containing protein n=1 Tax=Dendrothele bispora (strain CBS 962.96) TaxID=1314807 RepID=A0A4S8MM67_DENBC|nr:SAPS-domain-containing protein [Dendrothele bispora CBS 962.96]
MFWRFGFHNASSIDSLLDKDQVNLESILEEDDLLQECKAQNTRLIDYLARVDILKQLFGYISGQIEGQGEAHLRYPYTATQVLCSEIWSIVETCIHHQDYLLAPFWDAILDLSHDEIKSRQVLTGHFAKVNAVFLSKKPVEMLEFISKQPSVVDRLLNHIDNASIVDLLVRIIQLDEYPGGEGVLEWLSSENLIHKLLLMLSPSYPPDTHQVVADLIKGIISLSSSSSPAAPSTVSSIPGGGPNEPHKFLPSNQFARHLARGSSIDLLASYIFFDFSPGRNVEEPCPYPEPDPLRPPSDDASDHPVFDSDAEGEGAEGYQPPPMSPTEVARITSEREKTHLARLRGDIQPTFESAASSVVQSIGVVTELIRKNNSDYFEPYLFHTLRNRLIQVQQHQHQQGGSAEEGREALERAMKEMVDRMGVVHLGPLLSTVCERMNELVECLEKPRTLVEPLPTNIPENLPNAPPAPDSASPTTPNSASLSVPNTVSHSTQRVTPLTFERYRICELLAELLHCSNMAILNREKEWARLYDEDGRLQGGLVALEDLARLVSFGVGGGGSAGGEEQQESDEAGDGWRDRGGGGGDGGGHRHVREESIDMEMEMEMELEPALELPVSGSNPKHSDINPSVGSPREKDEDEDMGNSSDEPGSSTEDEDEDDETMETMEEIVMIEEQEEKAKLSQKENNESKTAPGAVNRAGGTSNPSNSSQKEMKREDRGEAKDVHMDVVSKGESTGTQRGKVEKDKTEIGNEEVLPGERLKERFLELGVLEMLLDLFFEFPWNNFLHNAVYDIFHQILTGNIDGGYNRELCVSLFRDARLMHRIVEAQRKNDEEVSKPKGVRLGYMGHLTLMAGDVITALERFPPDLRLQIMQYTPNPGWDEYVTGRYNETKIRNTASLGGGKPVVGPGARMMGEMGAINAGLGGGAGAGAGEASAEAGGGPVNAMGVGGTVGGGRPSRWKVDDDEPNTLTLAPIESGNESGQTQLRLPSLSEGGIKGEFRRSTTGKPTREGSADFGIAPMEDMDEDDDPQQFSRYGSTAQDSFGDSDDEDDESGWLSRSTFSLRNPPALSGLQERRPLGASGGFDDTFDPTGPSSTSDPFASSDDDAFGPFSDSSAVGGADPFTFSSFSDNDMEDGSSFDSFGDFGDFQGADDGLLDNVSDGELTPTAGSWTEFASGESSFVSEEGEGGGRTAGEGSKNGEEEDSLNLKEGKEGSEKGTKQRSGERG